MPGLCQNPALCKRGVSWPDNQATVRILLSNPAEVQCPTTLFGQIYMLLMVATLEVLKHISASTGFRQADVSQGSSAVLP